MGNVGKAVVGTKAYGTNGALCSWDYGSGGNNVTSTNHGVKGVVVELLTVGMGVRDMLKWKKNNQLLNIG
jgi:hypothetical protein